MGHAQVGRMTARTGINLYFNASTLNHAMLVLNRQRLIVLREEIGRGDVLVCRTSQWRQLRDCAVRLDERHPVLLLSQGHVVVEHVFWVDHIATSIRLPQVLNRSSKTKGKI